MREPADQPAETVLASWTRAMHDACDCIERRDHRGLERAVLSAAKFRDQLKPRHRSDSLDATPAQDALTRWQALTTEASSWLESIRTEAQGIGKSLVVLRTYQNQDHRPGQQVRLVARGSTP